MDGLPAAPDHASDIALSKLKFENGCSAARNFREHHVVGIFDQLPNDELEKFSHDGKVTTNERESTRICMAQKKTSNIEHRTSVGSQSHLDLGSTRVWRVGRRVSRRRTFLFDSVGRSS